MKRVVDYGTRPGREKESPELQITNYESNESLFMGTWQALTEKRGYPNLGKENVLDILYKKIVSQKFPIDYICMGEMTNLAALLFVHPNVTSSIARVFICPGEMKKKGMYPVSQENILHDPIAAKIVLNSCIKKIIAMADTEDAQKKQIYEYLHKEEGKEDPCLAYVSVQLDHGCTYGSLYIDRWNICKKNPNSILLECD